MSHGRTVTWLCVAVLAVSAALPASVGAGVPLTQIYISRDGSFKLSFPGGWLHKLDRGALVLATDAASLKGVGGGGSVDPGQVRVIIFPTRDALSQASGVELEGMDRAAMMQFLIDGADVPPGTQASQAEEAMAGDKAVSVLRTKNSLGQGVLFLAMETGQGEITTVAVETALGEEAQWEPIVMAIAATITVRPAASAPPTPTPKGRVTQSTPAARQISQWATTAEATSQYGTQDWSAMQATGAPDVTACGDDKLAWASSGSEGVDTLTLHYATPVLPSKISIYQTYNPGSITGVDLLPADGSAPIPLQGSADPDTTCPHTFALAVPKGVPAIDGVAIHLDQKIGGGWNEIDAVQLVGQDAGIKLTRQWATRAEATSQYGEEDWSAMQATGAPNVESCTDDRRAWASGDSEGQDSLTLYYDNAVTPTQVAIYQNHSPGSIVGVDLLPADGGDAMRVPGSADPSTICPHVFRLRVPPGFPPVDGVVIHLDQSIAGSWNEIDAVQLVGQQ